jgi:hypothetical protein
MATTTPLPRPLGVDAVSVPETVCYVLGEGSAVEFGDEV